MNIYGASPDHDYVSLLDFFSVISRFRKLILTITCSCAVITIITVYLLPETFQAETRILPPQRNASLSSQLIGRFADTVTALPLDLLGVSTPADLYIGMLRSRTVMDRIIKKYDLMKTYDLDYPEEAREKLAKNTTIETLKKSDIISIIIEDRNPQRAADIANEYVDGLKDLMKGLAITQAAQKRLFFEEQLKDSKASLIVSEETMKNFQEKTGALQIEEQAKAAIEGIATVRAKIAAKEVELKVMKTYSAPGNPDLQKMEEVLRGLKSELAKLETSGPEGHDPIMPTGRMPSIGMEYLRKYRDLKFNDTLFQLLLKQYELAKLDEAGGMPLIQVIDHAIPADKRTKPKRLLWVSTVTIIGFLISILIAFILEYRGKVSLNADQKPGERTHEDDA